MPLSKLLEPDRPSLLSSLATLRRRLRSSKDAAALSRRLGSVRRYSELESIPTASRPHDGVPGPGRLAVQLESVTADATSAGSRALVLTKEELRVYSSVLASLLKHAGLRRGTKLAIADYTMALPTLAASRYCNAVGVRGVEERLGVSVVCCDGVPDLLSRAMYVMETIRPEFVLVRSDLFTLARDDEGGRWGGVIPSARVLITYDEEVGPPLNLAEHLRLLPRADAALFCSLVSDGVFLYDRGKFLLEVVRDEGGRQAREGEPGYLCVTRLFNPDASAIRYVTKLEAVVKDNEVRAWT